MITYLKNIYFCKEDLCLCKKAQEFCHENRKIAIITTNYTSDSHFLLLATKTVTPDAINIL